MKEGKDMNINIRKAVSGEGKIADQFLTLLIRDEKKYDNNIDENVWIIGYYENFIENEDHIIMFAEIDNKIIGYIYGYLIKQNGILINNTSKIDAIYVDEEYRGNKVGEELIKKFKDWSKEKKVKTIEIDVCAQNERAKKLYSNNNFKEKKITMAADI